MIAALFQTYKIKRWNKDLLTMKSYIKNYGFKEKYFKKLWHNNMIASKNSNNMTYELLSKAALSVLKRVLATINPLKMTKN